MRRNYIIYPGVKLDKGAKIEDFSVIGKPAGGSGKKAVTKIGKDALIRSHTIIYAGNNIGGDFKTGHHVLIREDNKIGNKVSIGSGSVIEHHVEIHDGVRIHSCVFIPEYSILEGGCWIGPAVVLTNAPHPLCPKVKECLRGPRIRRGAKIGANSTILPGVTIGVNALVGAGSVVVHDVPENKVVAGNPAKVIKDISQLECKYNLVEKPY